ncbi:endonuclease [Aquibacillus rhizosphaerae]|uniref:Endonuclease n=1 Tax=Aquibacillus rhizosphaerae TaxID=3051431 RepID=A0ABT7L1H5_9BACI|nr:endonuclease [Aquibacillus sp. LR5S19]MDL4839224.1 endonuclease [Aquibacillus sp. LR5S19]
MINKYSSDFMAKMIGKLLGDGCITKQNGRKPRFYFSHTIRDKEWAIYCHNQLKQDIPLNDAKYRKITDNRLVQSYSERYEILSRTDNIITLLENKWYENRIKKVPFTLLEKYFNTISLAWWYQDDGSLKLKNNIPRKIILSTECFTPEENIKLVLLLKRLYQLEFSLDKQNRLIIYTASQIHYFLSLVQPYLQPCMFRKNIQLTKLMYIPNGSRRTTIHLPSHFTLHKPTQDINKSLEKLTIIINLYKNEKFYPTIYNKFWEEQKNIPAKKTYQIVITETNLSLLYHLKELTGFNFSQLCHFAFWIK